ncbi:MAG TPA: phosphonate metabolism transcriptional regulator PhnF [Burkholderiaceae bacterium]|nr:phosphonate metabolism transcriptional regulator PhnF [Burkholderiaceae bacterium]
MTTLFSSGAAAPAHLLRSSGVTMWKQIAEELEAEIRNRVYAQTGRLPSKNELARRFGVNRDTLRQAVAALAQQGLVSVEQGKGAFVRQEMVDYALSRRTRFSENLLRQGLLPSKQLLTAREVPAPERAARALQVRKGTRVLLAEMLDEASGHPIGLATAYYPAARFDGLLELLSRGTETTQILKHFGVSDYLRASSRITTQMPTDELAQTLRQPKTRPVLCVESIDVDLDGVPIKYGETIFVGDRVQLVVANEAPTSFPAP